MFISSKKSFYMIWVLAAALLLFLFIIPLSAGIPKSNFLMVIDYGNGHQRKFIGSTKSPISAWDSLQQAVAHSYFKVSISKDFRPNMIDSFQNSQSGRKWSLYINKKEVFDSPANIKINAGDTIVWKFE